MSELTYYVALPFVAADDGIAAGEATECFNSNAAIMGAEALSLKEGHVGAIAFSRTGDPGYGQFQRCQGAVLSGQRKPAVSAGWSISHRVAQMRTPDINSAQSAPPAASRPAPKILRGVNCRLRSGANRRAAYPTAAKDWSCQSRSDLQQMHSGLPGERHWHSELFRSCTFCGVG